MKEEKDVVVTDAQLEACIGKRLPAIDLKVIDHLDDYARGWLAEACLGFVALSDAELVTVTLLDPAGLEIDGRVLSIPVESFEHPERIREGASFGSLWVVPVLRETLRINGRIVEVTQGRARVAIDECYGHCAKALIRSDFWSYEGEATGAAGDLSALIDGARFAALATSNSAGAADLSPKGDPAGLLAQLVDGELCFAERPGNRRADSLRNLLQRPQLALVLLQPDSATITTLVGTASISSSLDLRERFKVKDKTPSLVVRVTDFDAETQTSRILSRRSMWTNSGVPSTLSPAEMFSAHMKLNKAKGVGATVTRALVSLPGLVQKSLDQDYKNNLY